MILAILFAAALAGAVAGNRQQIPVTLETPAIEGDAGRGEALYQRRCGACHSIDQNRVGPMHRNTYGSKAGSVEDFAYSKALDELDVVWNEATLDEWLQNPSVMAPGTRMGFRLTDEQERADIIAYLSEVSEQAEAETN
ncbi:c-type cytochrome [Hyphococcus sp.]|uniref:c-type cytochrome n=1 Tax=Hyphococcus sp. TaxID=2038636 RepID=UPI002081E2AA|nr:MAG: hypothetical protein DHS20C04_08720 [Marinicaulis sp.]